MKATAFQDTALRYFYEVARTGSLANASARLHVAPSAISRQISALEKVLGVPLFERSVRGMTLNPAGEVLATHAKLVQLDSERVLQEIQALVGVRTGRVAIAASAGFANEFLPPLIVEFRRQYPGVSFLVDVQSPAQISESLRSVDIDIGIQFSRLPEKDIRIQYRRPSTVLALMSPAHPLAQARTLTLAQLQAFALALPTEATTIRQAIDLVCARQELRLNPVLVSNNMPTLHSFVVHQGGISVSSEISVRHLVRAGLIVAVPVRDRGLDLRDIEVQTLVGRTLPPAVQTFLDYLTRALSEHLS